MRVLVVTGGIGSGKSTVCGILHDMRKLPVYDADSRVKLLYMDHPSLLDDIGDSLGCRLRDEQGNFVPGRLADRIFSDSSALEKVESLVFPAILDDFRSFSSGIPDDGIVVFESATILDKPQFDGFGDKVLLVCAPEGMRMKRTCMRDGIPEEKVLARMLNQKHADPPADDSACRRIDAVIINDGTVDDLVRKVDTAFRCMFSDAG